MASGTLDLPSLAACFPPESTYTTEHSWSPIAGVVLLGFGRERYVHNICEELIRCTENDPDARVAALRKLREGLLKASPLVGFPRLISDFQKSITALSALRNAVVELCPSVQPSLEKDKSLRAPVPLSERQKRGKEFFSRIYQQHTDRVLENLNLSSGGDLGEFAINCVYGDLVAETSILNEKVTSLLEFACCLGIGAPNQAKGHMFGAHNLGNGGEEILAAVSMIERVSQQLNLPLPFNRIDKTWRFLEKPVQLAW